MFLKFVLIICLLSGCYRIKNKTVNSVMGKVILIDPGHGGKDNGANINNIYEDEIVLNIALFLSKMLIEEDIIVLLTRDGDYDLSSINAKNHKSEDLSKRIKMIENNKVDMYLSLHLNSFLDTSVSGGQVFYQEHNNKSKDLALVIQENINSLYDKKRKPKKGDYYILNNTHKLGVLIEMGFLSSPLDRDNLTKTDFQQKLARAILNAIIFYFQM